jgi:SpoVK/Ycf46/Vps4 family AAA+-type ATPase
VARLIGELYHEAGLLARGHLVEVRAADLVAEFVGGTAARANAVIDRALDGVLFIDEAYMLTERERGGFGQEALDTLMTRMESERQRLVVIAAGYPDRMDRFISANPGLERRFPPDNRLQFPDYTAAELLEILMAQAAERQLEFAPEVERELPALVGNLYETRGEAFGNAGEMRNLLEACDRRRAARIVTGRLPAGEPVCLDDFPEHYRDFFNVKQVDLDDLFDELDGLVGMQPVKTFIHRQVRLLQLENMRPSGSARAKPSPRAMNMLFLGNPGTGKTTVARLLGRMLKNLGILRKGHCVETSRVDLVAGYVGQTALKTEARVKEALHGVLFIDEAYALARGAQTDYGQEAVDTLVKLIDRYPGRLVVVAAGYPDEMQQFIASNPGLASRFTHTVNFPDYSLDELWQILARLAQNNDYALDEDAKTGMQAHIAGLKRQNPLQFGNARAVYNLFEEMKANLAVRLLDGEAPPDPESLFRLQAQDIPLTV